MARHRGAHRELVALLVAGLAVAGCGEQRDVWCDGEAFLPLTLEPEELAAGRPNLLRASFHTRVFPSAGTSLEALRIDVTNTLRLPSMGHHLLFHPRLGEQQSPEFRRVRVVDERTVEFTLDVPSSFRSRAYGVLVVYDPPGSCSRRKGFGPMLDAREHATRGAASGEAPRRSIGRDSKQIRHRSGVEVGCDSLPLLRYRAAAATGSVRRRDDELPLRSGSGSFALRRRFPWPGSAAGLTERSSNPRSPVTAELFFAA